MPSPRQPTTVDGSHCSSLAMLIKMIKEVFERVNISNPSHQNAQEQLLCQLLSCILSSVLLRGEALQAPFLHCQQALRETVNSGR